MNVICPQCRYLEVGRDDLVDTLCPNCDEGRFVSVEEVEDDEQDDDWLSQPVLLN